MKEFVLKLLVVLGVGLGVAHVPWLSVEGGRIDWDNPRSITEKVGFVKSNGLGRWIVWYLGGDYISAKTAPTPVVECNQAGNARRHGSSSTDDAYCFGSLKLNHVNDGKAVVLTRSRISLLHIHAVT
jgi:GH18 family chitinase